MDYRWLVATDRGEEVIDSTTEAIRSATNGGHAVAVGLAREDEGHPFLVVPRPQGHPHAVPTLFRRRRGIAMAGDIAPADFCAICLGWRDKDQAIFFFVIDDDQGRHIFVSDSLWGDWDDMLARTIYSHQTA